LIPFDFQEKSTVTDHYLYLAMLGPALAVAWILTTWRNRALTGLAIVLLSIWGVRNFTQTWVWRDSPTCLSYGLAVNPKSWWLHDMLGYELLERERPAEAAEHFGESIRYAPRYADGHAHLAAALAQQGSSPRALSIFMSHFRSMPASRASTRCWATST
jgi:tetratricopeptide (TPR) repeat protein